MMSKSFWARYIHDMVKVIDFSMHCGYIEDYITRCLQSGVRHQVDTLIGLHGKEFIDCLYASAKDVRTVSETAYVDSCYIEEQWLKATFDKEHMPELKTKGWWCKEYTKTKVVGEKKEIIEEKFRAFVTTLSFKYNLHSKELFMVMKFKVQKWAILGDGADWTDSP